MLIESKLEQRCVCRKCKTAYLSVNGSPCPKCSEENKKLAAKREDKRGKKKAKKNDGAELTQETVNEQPDAGDDK